MRFLSKTGKNIMLGNYSKLALLSVDLRDFGDFVWGEGKENEYGETKRTRRRADAGLVGC
jgi:hypothetical protein